MSEKKKALPSFNAELHSILPLPIEIVAQRLYSLNMHGYSTEIEKVNEDFGHFFVQSLISAKVKAEGRFLRWNGTFTRVDVQPKSRELRSWLRITLSFGSFILLLMLALYIGWLVTDTYSLCLLPVIAIFGASIGIPLLWGTSWAFTAGNNPHLQKTVDEMMQAIADTLTQDTDGALEFDGSSLSLEMLLKEEKYRHFRLGEDGEIEDL